MDESVDEFVKQWLIKAQDDWDMVQILVGHEHSPTSGICFHCQQC